MSPKARVATPAQRHKWPLRPRRKRANKNGEFRLQLVLGRSSYASVGRAQWPMMLVLLARERYPVTAIDIRNAQESWFR
jgi:hypothetical protein